MIPREFDTSVSIPFPYIWSSQLNLVKDGIIVANIRYTVPLLRKDHSSLQYHGSRLKYRSNLRNAFSTLRDFYTFFKDILFGTEKFQDTVEESNIYNIKLLDYHFRDWMKSRGFSVIRSLRIPCAEENSILYPNCKPYASNKIHKFLGLEKIMMSLEPNKELQHQN